MGYRVVNGKLYEVGNFTPSVAPARNPQDNLNFEGTKSFDEILKKQLDKKDSFTLSNHAAERLKLRDISLNEADMKKINEGINKAQDKGSKDCLILYKDVALVTSIKNRTIITAVDKEGSKGNVFTNIDSVILL